MQCRVNIFNALIIHITEFFFEIPFRIVDAPIESPHPLSPRALAVAATSAITSHGSHNRSFLNLNALSARMTSPGNGMFVGFYDINELS